MIHFYSKKIFTFLFILLITTSVYSQTILLKSNFQLNREQTHQYSTSSFNVVDGKLTMSKLPLHPSILKALNPATLERTKSLYQTWASGAG
jgi:hypothetical protein